MIRFVKHFTNNKNIGDLEQRMLIYLADLFSQVLLQLLVLIVIFVLSYLDTLQLVATNNRTC